MAMFAAGRRFDLRDLEMLCATCPTETELSAFQTGDLPEQRLEEVADHLESCDRCETLARRLDTCVDAILASLRAGSGSSHNAPAGVFELPPTVAFGGRPNSGELRSYPFLERATAPGELGRLANYRVLELLGRGGMGLVFRAEDIKLGRPVALKVLNPLLGADKEGWQRFVREARIMAAIKDERLVAIYHAGEARGVAYLAMELLQGETLAEWMTRVDRTNVAEMLAVCEGIAQGLASVHRHGLVHRDLKPSNLWMEQPRGGIKVLDLGLARFLHDEANLTGSGTVLGTPAFMSPEQTRGEPVDVRSDLFSLGAVFYVLLTGREPFQASNTIAILTALTFRTPTAVRQLNPAVPAALSDLVGDLLEKTPANRPGSVDEVLTRLAEIAAGRGHRTMRSSLARLRRIVHFKTTTGRRPVGIALVAATSLMVCLGLAMKGDLTRSRPARHATGTWEGTAQPGRVYLTDLTPVSTVHWPFGPPPDRPVSTGEIERVVCVDRKLSPHGIFMHPPVEPLAGEPSSIDYRLDQRFKTFTAKVALNDGPTRSGSPITFSVYGDGALLWRSQPVLTAADLQDVSLPIDHADRLRIEARCESEVRACHAVWIEPSLFE